MYSLPTHGFIPPVILQSHVSLEEWVNERILDKKRSPKNAEVLLDNAINPRYQQIRALM